MEEDGSNLEKGILLCVQPNMEVISEKVEKVRKEQKKINDLAKENVIDDALLKSTSSKFDQIPKYLSKIRKIKTDIQKVEEKVKKLKMRASKMNPIDVNTVVNN